MVVRVGRKVGGVVVQYREWRMGGDIQCVQSSFFHISVDVYRHWPLILSCDIGRGRIKGRIWWWTGDCDIKADGGVGAGVIDEGWG